MGNTSAREIIRPSRPSPSPTAIIDHFRSVYHREGLNDLDLDQIIRPNICFISMRIAPRSLKGNYSDPAAYFAEFTRVYKNWMQIAYGNNFRRKRNHQPLTYVCVDYPDSRLVHAEGNGIHLPDSGMRGVFDLTKERGNRAPYILGEMLHIHALLLLRPGYGQACREVIEDYARVSNNDTRGLIDMQLPDPSRSLVGLASYCSKGVDEIATKTGKEAWTLLPR